MAARRDRPRRRDPRHHRAARAVGHRRDRPGHDPVSSPWTTWWPWAGLCPQVPHPVRHLGQKPGRRNPGNTYLRGYLGWPLPDGDQDERGTGERHARIARRRGPAKAQVATARSIAVIIWHLLNDRDARYHDLGPDHYQNRTDKNRKARSHIRQLEALGYTVTLTQTQTTG